MSYAKVWKVSCSMFALALAAPLLTGCAIAPGESGEGDEENVAEVEQGISCSDGACTGLNPYTTNCILDQVVEKTGSITDQNGTAIGTATLYYSPTCHAIWGYAGFTASHGNFQVCATDITDLSQPSQCLSYASSFFGAVSKMQYLRVNDFGYESVLITSSPFGSGGTGTFKRTF